MTLPNATAAIIPIEKLRDYLLSSEHPVGRYKAAFFRSLGYRASEAEILEADLRSLIAAQSEELETTDYGKKYAITGTLTGPNGRSAEVVSVWIILADEDTPRFITAYPED